MIMNLFILVMNVFILLAQNRDAYRLSKILNINNEKISEVPKVYLKFEIKKWFKVRNTLKVKVTNYLKLRI